MIISNSEQGSGCFACFLNSKLNDMKKFKQLQIVKKREVKKVNQHLATAILLIDTKQLFGEKHDN